MKCNSLPTRCAGVKPHFSATFRDAAFSTSQFRRGATDSQFARRPVQQCVESARSQSLSAKGWRDEIGHPHDVIDWAKLDSADRLACRHAPNGEREPRSGIPVVLTAGSR